MSYTHERMIYLEQQRRELKERIERLRQEVRENWTYWNDGPHTASDLNIETESDFLERGDMTDE